MCGIAGLWNRKREPVAVSDILRMSALIEHRGPDDCGHVLINSAGKLPLMPLKDAGAVESGYDLALASRRLSIMDLSQSGHMPMTQHGCTLVYNGEIYNYLELKAELQQLGHCFTSTGDTEVLLHAYLQWGVECLERLNGMFAFALWDSRTQKLFCARDRLGIKPFYYWLESNRLVFASEIRSILAVLDSKPAVNERMVYDYLAVNRLDHTEETFFEGVLKLPAGCLMLADQTDIRIERYWHLCPHNVSPVSQEESADRFRELFHDSVRRQMRSDVTVGSCLSGGMDSSGLVSVAAPFAGSGMKTFTARYSDRSMDEWDYAEAVINNSQVEGIQLLCNSKCFWLELPEVVWSQEEPFGGPSIYSQWNLMRTVKMNGVSVILDGQGGDELMCGYAKYFFYSLREMHRSRAYLQLAGSLGHAFFNGGKHLINLRGAQKYMPSRFRKSAARLLRTDFAGRHSERDLRLQAQNVRELQICDIEKTSIPVLLRYEDKNAMAHSVESRVPFLDHRLVEFAVSLPTEHKIRGGQAKRVMRHAIGPQMPQKVLRRKSKLGFGGSFVSWIDELRPQLQQWVDCKELRVDAYTERESLRELLANSDPNIFRMLILDRWMERFGY
jgi:asparagine synthase (glutamine-hydrolysing)